MGKKLVLAIVLLITIIATILGIGHNRFFYRVSYSGNLKVEGAQLKNRFGENIQLRGLSANDMKYSDAITHDNLKYLRDEWDLNIFRVPIDVEEDSYINNEEEYYENIKNIINICKDLDIYIMIDWNIKENEENLIYEDEAKEFFNKITTDYKNEKNIIYEISNETEFGWEDTIYPYSEKMIQTIRNNSEDAVIIIGMPNKSTDVYSPIRKKLEYKNIMYGFNFYTATNGYDLMYNFDIAQEEKIPLFVTQWGTCEDTKDGNISSYMSEMWIDKLNDKNVSWINYSYSYKKENSALLSNYIKLHLDENGMPKDTDNLTEEEKENLEKEIQEYNEKMKEIKKNTQKSEKEQYDTESLIAKSLLNSQNIVTYGPTTSTDNEQSNSNKNSDGTITIKNDNDSEEETEETQEETNYEGTKYEDIDTTITPEDLKNSLTESGKMVLGFMKRKNRVK